MSQLKLILGEEYKMSKTQAMSDLEFISHYFKDGGTHLIPIDFQYKFQIEFQYKMRLNYANGFGRIDPSMENFHDMIWDWSHIRDSSDEAIANIAEGIRRYIALLSKPKKRNNRAWR